MALIEWDDAYSVGINSVDTQHKRLFDIINHFDEEIKKGHDKSALSSIFDELLDYTQTHFSEEEQLMQAAGYADYDKHKALHEKLIAQVVKLRDDFEADQPGTEAAMLIFLKHWLSNHIMKIDQQYSPHLLAKGVI